MNHRFLMAGAVLASLTLCAPAIADETGMVGGAIAGAVVGGPVGLVVGGFIGNEVTNRHHYRYRRHLAARDRAAYR